VSFLVVNKGCNEVYECNTLLEVATLVCNEQPVAETLSDLQWQLKRTGRYDRADGAIVVVPTDPASDAD
jgi:hypothetical protein